MSPACTDYAKFMNKKPARPIYEALIEKIKSGELTRKQAAIASTITGLSADTFMSWLKSSGAIKDPAMRAARRSAGQASTIHAPTRTPTRSKPTNKQ